MKWRVPDQRLWDMRRKRGWTLRETSKRSGISSSRIRDIETDDKYSRPPTFKEKLGLCKAFGIGTEFFKDRG